MDEPEAALSPQRQLAMLARMQELVGQGAQFIIATHSPILLGLPGAQILNFTADGIAPCAHEDTDAYAITRGIMLNRAAMLRELLGED